MIQKIIFHNKINNNLYWYQIKKHNLQKPPYLHNKRNKKMVINNKLCKGYINYNKIAFI